MSNANLVEISRDLIMDAIKANIDARLAGIRSMRNDPIVSTDKPKSYFIFDAAHTYQCPAIFVVVDSMEFTDDSTGPNFVNGIIRMYVSAVVEDREAELLTIKTERYQAALFQILHLLTLYSSDNTLKIFSRVLSARFSELYTKKRGDGMADFRKEVSLELEVKHWENPDLVRV